MRDLLTSIAVFVLAHTETTFRPNKIHEYHSFENRMKAIHDTWGSQIEHMYYVVGTNKYDYEFLHDKANNCRRISEESGVAYLSAVGSGEVSPSTDTSRRLAAHSPQIRSMNNMVNYKCAIAPEVSKMRYKKLMRANLTDATPMEYIIPNPEPFQVLYVGNCTGEYFGYGPTCRCQESMRYFQLSYKLRSVQWYMFLDDDVYIRPTVLDSFLSTFLTRFQKEAKAGRGAGAGAGSATVLAMVAPQRANLRLESSRKKNELRANNSVCLSGAFHFTYAQPAILTRDAVELLLAGALTPATATKAAWHRGSNESASEGEEAPRNCPMTDLQRFWGGSHDFILGLSIYIRNIPVYSFGRYVSRTVRHVCACACVCGGGLHLQLVLM